MGGNVQSPQSNEGLIGGRCSYRSLALNYAAARERSIVNSRTAVRVLWRSSSLRRIFARRTAWCSASRSLTYGPTASPSGDRKYQPRSRSKNRIERNHSRNPLEPMTQLCAVGARCAVSVRTNHHAVVDGFGLFDRCHATRAELERRFALDGFDVPPTFVSTPTTAHVRGMSLVTGRCENEIELWV